MKQLFTLLTTLTIITMVACNSAEQSQPQATTATPTVGGQKCKRRSVAKDVVKVAVITDHTTLVAALKQAELVTALPMPAPSPCLPHQ